METNETTLYYLWLGTACNFEPDLMDMCSSNLISRETENDFNIYNSPEYLSRLYENRKEVQARIDKTSYKNKINLCMDLSRAEEIFCECRKLGIEIITLSNKLYPKRLRNIYCPPKLLFVIGDIKGTDDVLGISVVGTRTATETGIYAAENIAYGLAGKGVIITSGMAKGIDRAAHIGALNAGGRTFAVLSGGVDVVYPAANRDIYNAICKSGAIISERPPHCIGQPRFYQQRNRIITGLSLGVLITEGKQNSGTSITARHALENNRDIFAVPGDINLPQSQLPNSLIKDGAALVRDASDILQNYSYLYPNQDFENVILPKKRNPFSSFKKIFSNVENIPVKKKSVTKTVIEPEIYEDIEKASDAPPKSNNSDVAPKTEDFFKKDAYLALSEADKAIITIVGEYSENGILIDELAEKSGLEINALNSKLLLWQIKGLITQGGGSKVFLKT